MNINEKNINQLRVLACEMIEKAKSGHPGIALSAAPMIYTLYKDVLCVSPKDEKNIFRDRFVLSAGHGSSILYATLSMFGYEISINDLQNFRSIGSITPGHPEFGVTPGIDASTGPLGQGVANAVGLAIAQEYLAGLFNKPDINLFDNYTYAIVGDGCMQEGISCEALSLAGTLKLNKLIVLYDCNKITIDGRIEQTFNQDTKKVMEGYGFEVIRVKDGNSYESILNAINEAKKSDKPSFIIVDTIIGYGSVLEGSEKSHGAPLGEQNIKALKEKLGINTGNFEILPEVASSFKEIKQRFSLNETKWKINLAYYKKHYKKDYERLVNFIKLKGVENINLQHIQFNKDVSTREYSGAVLNEIAKVLPNIIGGSADLSGSTKAKINDGGKFSAENQTGRNILFGVREHAMGAICNGIAYYGGLIPFSSTFFEFTDYMRGSIRMSALNHLKHLYIMSHDSIAVGEDGPTHQAVEQITSFRCMPNLDLFRPCNLEETKFSYLYALKNNNPTMLVLSRQTVPTIISDIKLVKNGGYIIKKEENNKLDSILIATGSEVALALEVAKFLEGVGYGIRVVSMPCTSLFDKQPEKYKQSVLPKNVKSIVSLEAGSTLGWHKYTGSYGLNIGVDEFGLSGKSADVYKHFHLTVSEISKLVVKNIKENKWLY